MASVSEENTQNSSMADIICNSLQELGTPRFDSSYTEETGTPFTEESTFGKKKGKNWKPAEDAQLCKSWSHISQDPLTSTEQKSDMFWERVAENFNNTSGNETETRNKRSVQQR